MKSHTILLTVILLVFSLSISAQSRTDSLNVEKKGIGGEQKGLYYGGGSAAIGGLAIGILSNGFSDYPRSGLPIIASSIALAPGSLLGLGLGSLFAKKHSRFSNSVQLGLGLAYSSPIFSEFVSGNAHRAGISVQLLSPELGPWRYRLGFNQFLSEEYAFEEIESYRGQNTLSWWELNLDLQYLIKVNDKFAVYPFIGTQYNQVNAMGSSLDTEILVNYGIGTNLGIGKCMNVYAEMQYTLDPDDNPGNMIFNLGVLYRL